jgi:D-beta-D-heptose 7-phosphate kinase/D-beta-D-heptose 1-phosphate adenosyltransferase
MTVRPGASKILGRVELIARFGPGRSIRVVFTNGCFDLLHVGHVTCLERARALGDALVVGVNSDASARGLGKGPGRPYVGESQRARVIAALEVVDAVCVFDEDTPAELIEALVPDVLVKGADWSPDEVVGREVVEAAGGRVELIPLVEGMSTSSLVRRIREEEG